VSRRLSDGLVSKFVSIGYETCATLGLTAKRITPLVAGSRAWLCLCPGARVAVQEACLVTDASREAPNSSAPFGNDW
jgi:hypothetical protein